MPEEFTFESNPDKPVEPVDDVEHRAAYEQAEKHEFKKDVHNEVLADQGKEVPLEDSEQWDGDIFKEGFYGIGVAMKCEKLKEMPAERCNKYAKWMSILFPLAVSSRIIAAFMLLVMLIADLSPCIEKSWTKLDKKDGREAPAKTSESEAKPWTKGVVILQDAV